MFSYSKPFNRRNRTIIDTHHKKRLSPAETKDAIEKSLDADKAENIICISLANTSALADYMIVASGTSSRHVSALVQKLKEYLQNLGVKNIRVEGLGQSDWVVLDAGDVIVHVFRPEVREFYAIEKMWSNHPVLTIAADHIHQA